MVGKGMGRYICHVCNTRGAQLSRRGGWKEFMAKFETADPDEIATFWKSVKPCGEGNVLDKQMAESASRRQSRTDVNNRLGDYQPLSWFVTNYDQATADRVEQRCKDTYECEVFGLCYRVPILGGGQIDQTVNDRTWSATGNTSRVPAILPPSAGNPQTRRGQPPTDDSKAKAALITKGKTDAQKAITSLASAEVRLSTVLSSTA